MFKSKKFIKSVLACGLTAAMMLSTAVLISADFEVTSDDIEPTRNYERSISPAIEPTAPALYRTDRQPMEADMEEQMKAALDTAKAHINIDEKIFTEFSFDVYDSNGKSNWNFTWSSSDYTSYIYITVLDDKVVSYNKYNYNESASGDFAFAKITKAEAEEKAIAFLKKILGNEADKFKVQSNTIYYNSDSYNIWFAEYYNGYRNTVGSTPSVNVDKLTGEITNYSNYNYFDREFEYQDSSKIITPEQAAKAYVEKISLSLSYVHYYDYSTRKLNVFAVYRPQYNWDKYISAVTGDLIDVRDMDLYRGVAAPQLAGGRAYNDRGDVAVVAEISVSPAPSYTSAELSELERIRDYITREKALETALEILGLSREDIENYTQQTTLNKDHINQNQYLWYINLYSENNRRTGSYSVVIDARNGNVISYSRYSYVVPIVTLDANEPEKDMSERYKYTYEEAKKIALDEINKLSANSLENFEFVESTVPTEKQDYYRFVWNRTVNGYIFDANNISIQIDNTEGEITYYYSIWYEDIEFPEIGKDIISQSEAFAKMIEHTEYTPAYIETSYDEEKNVSTMSLVYMLDNYWIMIDPSTGDYLNWRGNPDTSLLEPDYDDVKGHWSEKIVMTLFDNGIYVWGGKFEPDRAITAKEFIDLMQIYTNINHRYYYIITDITDKLYSYINDDNNELSEEKSDAVITKQDAAKIICELLGFDKLMKKPEYLLYPFEDDADEEYKGYITICYMLGIIEGSDGKYDAALILTRAEAAQMLYNLLTN